ncbi:hypothetical protein L2E82_01445 [Cichorium intybus]|uniref:Uncharacterized protein n=1 Tax=Cichorium intybus TaxID=13427 RepID=A0ACB9GZB6_CICIN|nr:hypothetical protein L2E82_01445 [Cichorium intybus]
MAMIFWCGLRAMIFWCGLYGYDILVRPSGYDILVRPSGYDILVRPSGYDKLVRPPGYDLYVEDVLLKREYEAEINAVVDYNQVVQVEMTARHDEYTLMLLNWGFMRKGLNECYCKDAVCTVSRRGKIIVRSELGTSGQVLKRTRVGVEDSSRAPTIESTGSAFESGVGRHLQLLVNKFYIRSVSDDCSTIMMKAEDVCERISRNWDPVTGWHNLEEDIRELKQYIDVKSIRTDIRSCAVVCVLTVKPLERKAAYFVGPLILVVGTTY